MDLFDLVAKIRLDDSEYKDGVGKAKGTFSTLTSGVKTGLTTVAKVGAAAVTAGVAGVTALTKMGVEAYAQYEQLTGGVETLFGTSSNTVMQYAENAYKTSGLSANAYMETVTSFSASLIQSLDGDTAKAAKVADMAITDMSDNANKMGTDIGMIQNAYNGFAKGNFTMLDNLKLGYGGTKEEMQRLLDKAEEISGIEYDISSFSDISEAIHVIQQDMEISGISYEEAMAKVASGEMTMKEAMDAMGTTAREAATTIEGSLNMMKGAWQNLVVGMADSNADLSVLVDNFVASALIAKDQVLPAVERTLQGVGTLITEMAPIISEALPTLVETVLPSLITAGSSLIAALANGAIAAAPAVLQALVDSVKTILVDGFGVPAESVEQAFTFIKDAIDKCGEAFQNIKGFIENVGAAFQNTTAWIKEHGTGLSLVAIAVGTFTAAVIANNVATAIQDAGGLARIAWMASMRLQFTLSTASLAAHTAATWLANTASTAFGATMALLTSPITLTIAAIGALIAIIVLCVKHWDEITAAVSSAWASIKEATSEATAAVGAWISEKFEAAKAKTTEIFNSIKEAISTAWDAIKSGVSNAVDAVGTAISTAWDSIKSATSTAFNAVLTTVTTIWNNVTSAVSNAINTVKSAISSGMESASSTVSGILDNISSKFTTIFEGAKQIVTNAISAIKGAFNFSWSLPKLSLPHISVYGGEPPYGIGGAGSLPSFSISWYKKAMNNAMVLSNPTIFGYSSESGKFLGGGDGNGNEVIAGESYLMRMISNAVAAQMDGVTRGVTVNQYIQSVPQTPVEMAAATEAYFEQARWML